GGFGQVADLSLRFGRAVDHGDTANFGIAGCGWQESGHHPHGGGFAGTVGPEEAEHFAFPHGKREVIDGGLSSELFGQVLAFDHGVTWSYIICVDASARGAASDVRLKEWLRHGLAR